jgi:hypothetical protein
MSGSLESVGDDWLAVVTIFAPALIPLIYAVGLWIIFRENRHTDAN